MAKNIRFFRDQHDAPCARGPISEKLLTVFLETDIQEDTVTLSSLLDDIWAVEHGQADSREFQGNAHSVTITPELVTIRSEEDDSANVYTSKLKHFYEVLLDWEAFV